MKRRLFRTAVLLAVVFAVLLIAGVRWRLLGWLRGEAFYRGRPTSYFSASILYYADTYLAPHHQGA